MTQGNDQHREAFADPPDVLYGMKAVPRQHLQLLAITDDGLGIKMATFKMTVTEGEDGESLRKALELLEPFRVYFKHAEIEWGYPTTAELLDDTHERYSIKTITRSPQMKHPGISGIKASWVRLFSTDAQRLYQLVVILSLALRNTPEPLKKIPTAIMGKPDGGTRYLSLAEEIRKTVDAMRVYPINMAMRNNPPGSILSKDTMAYQEGKGTSDLIGPLVLAMTDSRRRNGNGDESETDDDGAPRTHHIHPSPLQPSTWDAVISGDYTKFFDVICPLLLSAIDGYDGHAYHGTPRICGAVHATTALCHLTAWTDSVVHPHIGTTARLPRGTNVLKRLFRPHGQTQEILHPVHLPTRSSGTRRKLL
jgi:hypothetical protein